MSETVLVSIISLLGTLGGTLGGIVVSNKLTNYRLEQLEKKVSEHNNLIKRTYDLEAKDALIEERMTQFEKQITSMQEQTKN